MASKRLWSIVAAAIVLWSCLILITVGVVAARGWVWPAFPGPSTVETPGPTAVGLATTTVTSIPPETPPPALSADVRAQMDQIQDEVASLRGLNPTGPVDRTLLTPDELRQRVLDDFLDDHSQEEAEEDARLLALLGLLEPGFDLWTLYLDLYREQIAGYYDAEGRQMFVVAGSGFGGPERETYAHEYVHALQDQNYGIGEGLDYSDEACEAEGERCAAIQALLEGDASRLESQWLRTYATAEDREQIQEFYSAFDSPVFTGAPEFLQQDFLFPYVQGLGFVTELALEGDWAAVDAAYANPPVSTEQILHPERYPGDVPTLLEVPELPTALGEAFREIDRDTLGEWYTRLVLQRYLPDRTAEDAAEGWGGDYYLAFYDGQAGQGALVLATRWDTFVDAQESFAALLDYGDARFGGRASFTPYLARWSTSGFCSLLERSSDQTLWILAPSEDAVNALRQAVPFPARMQ